ncbi:MAG: hypothetical protein ACP6IY_06730 [Promethearchaeia archaeon]
MLKIDFFEYLEKFKDKNFPLILFCLLDRIPIIVIGKDPEEVDLFLIELTELLDFRKELVYNTDFISSSEYLLLVQNESIDYHSQRIQIRCSQKISFKALELIDFFDSWIIGFTYNNKKELEKIEKIIDKKIKNYLKILIHLNDFSIFLKGFTIKNLDLSFEKYIFKKIFQDTEKAINRMKRVVSEKIYNSNIQNDIVLTLLDFENEKKEVKKNIFRKELHNFYSAAKGAFFILSRLNLLHKFDLNTQIGGKTLLETIDYKNANIERLISFIRKEWGEDFSNIVENGKKISIGDKITSMWG